MWIGIAGGTTALLAGLGLSRWATRRMVGDTETDEQTPVIDVEQMEPLIRDAAERWAQAQGRPEAAGLVADKLRTLYVITYGKTDRPKRLGRWSR